MKVVASIYELIRNVQKYTRDVLLNRYAPPISKVTKSIKMLVVKQ